MHDENDTRTTPGVRKLLRVLVAGGVALAGAAGARADEKPTPPSEQTTPAGKGDKDKAKEKEKEKEKKAEKEKKKAEDERKAEEGGGVKGW